MHLQPLYTTTKVYCGHYFDGLSRKRKQANKQKNSNKKTNQKEKKRTSN